MSTTLTITVAASLMDDLGPVMESNTLVDDPATAESVAAYYAATPSRGRGFRLEFQTAAGLRDFRADVEYRLQHHQPTRVSGTYYPSAAVRSAATRTLVAIDALLAS